MLDIAFHPQTGKWLVVDYGSGKVLSVDHRGAPIGFLWSKSLVFHGDDVLVTSLSLDVETAISQLADELGLADLVGRNLKVHTISKIKRRIPSMPK